MGSKTGGIFLAVHLKTGEKGGGEGERERERVTERAIHFALGESRSLRFDQSTRHL